MKIIADENIPFAEKAFGSLGEVILLPGREITNEILKDAGVLIIRSVTRVNKSLLENTPVRFVGTATIGTDHIDIEYLKQSNIYFADAAGCNSDSVAEYVFCAILKIVSEKNLKLSGLTLGVVGEGNIGSRVVRFGEALGMNVLKNDPPKQRLNKAGYANLDLLLKESDIITFHAPFNPEGADKTFHLLDYNKLRLCKENVIIINSSRGPVINNEDLLSTIEEKNITAVLDVWENEPNLNPLLLEKAYLGTAHIAGYSYEGKVNGTVFIYNVLCNFLKVFPDWKPVMPEVPDSIKEINSTGSREETLNSLFKEIYDIAVDDKKLRRILELDSHDYGKYFDFLRKNYWMRREFSNYSVKTEPYDEELNSILKLFRFKM